MATLKTVNSLTATYPLYLGSDMPSPHMSRGQMNLLNYSGFSPDTTLYYIYLIASCYSCSKVELLHCKQDSQTPVSVTTRQRLGTARRQECLINLLLIQTTLRDN